VQDPVPNSTLDGITSTPTILVDGEQYRGWVTKSTNTVLADASLKGAQGFGTPTVVVDGKRLDNLTQVITAIDQSGK
jgi:hypothetical protein